MGNRPLPVVSGQLLVAADHASGVAIEHYLQRTLTTDC
jgi:hypothetical protein